MDFVVESSNQLVAIEVKSGRRRESLPGLAAFCSAHPNARPLLIGGEGMKLDRFLSFTIADIFARQIRRGPRFAES